jgi:hypothetical protein
MPPVNDESAPANPKCTSSLMEQTDGIFAVQNVEEKARVLGPIRNAEPNIDDVSFADLHVADSMFSDAFSGTRHHRWFNVDGMQDSGNPFGDRDGEGSVTATEFHSVANAGINA